MLQEGDVIEVRQGANVYVQHSTAHPLFSTKAGEKTVGRYVVFYLDRDKLHAYCERLDGKPMRVRVLEHQFEPVGKAVRTWAVQG